MVNRELWLGLVSRKFLFGVVGWLVLGRGICVSYWEFIFNGGGG